MQVTTREHIIFFPFRFFSFFLFHLSTLRVSYKQVFCASLYLPERRTKTEDL